MSNLNNGGNVPEEDKSDCWCLLVKTIKERTRDADYVEQVRNLLDQGHSAEPNWDANLRHNHDFPPCPEQSPLWTALYVGAVDVVSLLLTRGASPMDPTSQKLFGAALDPDMIEVMETHGIDYHINPTDRFMMGLLGPLDVRDKDYGQRLFNPKKQMEKIKTLFKKGMKVDRINTRLNPHFSIVTYLLKVAQVMSEEHRYDLVKLFIEHGADLNIPDGVGREPFSYAVAYYNKYRILKLLLDYGADVNTADYRGETPLHYAAAKQVHRIIKILLRHGANIDAAIDDFKTTPLLTLLGRRTRPGARQSLENYCLSRDDHLLPSVLLFIEKGVNLRYCNHSGKTALHYAAQKSLYKVCKLLIEHGADINSEDNSGKTPIVDFARSSKYFRHLFFSFSSSPDRLSKSQLDLFDLFIQRGADINKKKNGTDIPLILEVCSNTSVPLLSHILEKYGNRIEIPSYLDVPENLDAKIVYKLVQLGVISTSAQRATLQHAVETHTWKGYDLVRHINPHGYQRLLMELLQSNDNQGTERGDEEKDFRRWIKNDLSVACPLTTCCVFAIRHRMLEIRRNNISILPGLRQLSAVLPASFGPLITLDCFMLD